LTQTTRKRGGQPGNQNARVHGFYSSLIRPEDASDLMFIASVDLSSEIELIRLHLRQLMESAGQPTTLAEHMNLLRVISLATHSLARLVRIQNFNQSDTELIEEVHRVADIARKRMEKKGLVDEDEDEIEDEDEE
jgi:hypothetical protein